MKQLQLFIKRNKIEIRAEIEKSRERLLGRMNFRQILWHSLF